MSILEGRDVQKSKKMDVEKSPTKPSLVDRIRAGMGKLFSRARTLDLPEGFVIYEGYVMKKEAAEEISTFLSTIAEDMLTQNLHGILWMKDDEPHINLPIALALTAGDRTTSLPKNLTVKSITMSADSKIEEFPDNLTVLGGVFIAQGSKLKRIGKNLHVKGAIAASMQRHLEYIGPGLRASQANFSRNRSLRTFPKDAEITNELDLEGCINLIDLPEYLSVGGTITVANTGIRAVPRRFNVRGSVDFQNCNGLVDIPEEIEWAPFCKVGFKGCHFNLDLNVYKRLARIFNENRIYFDPAVSLSAINDDTTEEQFIALAAQDRNDGAPFIRSNFAKFSHLENACEVGHVVFDRETWKGAQWLMEHESSRRTVQEHFDVPEDNVSDELVGHAQYFVLVTIEEIKRETGLLMHRKELREITPQEAKQKVKESLDQRRAWLTSSIPPYILKRAVCAMKNPEAASFLLCP